MLRTKSRMRHWQQISQPLKGRMDLLLPNILQLRKLLFHSQMQLLRQSCFDNIVNKQCTYSSAQDKLAALSINSYSPPAAQHESRLPNSDVTLTVQWSV
mmetsp:Transcript_15777/g.25937  ORF Transcript_15777/g.25937 Transcript_15777/m.25937 type:complete len:99 (+) Transcript_15777:523-819(+)